MAQARQELINYIPTTVKEQGALFPYYSNTSYINSQTLVQNLDLGVKWWTKGPQKDAGGNSFQVVKAGAGLTRGQLVAWATPTTGTYTTASSTVASIVTNVNAAAINSEIDNFIFFNDISVMKRIKANTKGPNSVFTISLVDPTIASKPYDSDALTAAELALLVNGNPVSIIRPYQVIVCTAALVPCGVALGTVTSGYYTIIQKDGLAEVQSTGNGVALAVNAPSIPSAAGVQIGFAGTATALVGTASGQFGGTMMLPQVAWSAAGALLVPTLVNFP